MTSAWAGPSSPATPSGPASSTSSIWSSHPWWWEAGTRALADGVRQHLELLDERRFPNGMVHLHYRAADGG